MEVLARWALMKEGWEMKEFQDLETHLQRPRDLAGRQVNISVIISGGRRSMFLAPDIFSFSWNDDDDQETGDRGKQS